MNRFHRVAASTAPFVAVIALAFAAPQGGNNLTGHTFTVYGTGPAKLKANGHTSNGSVDVNGSMTFGASNAWNLSSGPFSIFGSWTNQHKHGTVSARSGAQTYLGAILPGSNPHVDKYKFLKCGAYTGLISAKYVLKFQYTSGGVRLKIKGTANVGGYQTA